MRRQLWLQLSGAAQRRLKVPPHYYADAALQGASSPFAHQIELVGGLEARSADELFAPLLLCMCWEARRSFVARQPSLVATHHGLWLCPLRPALAQDVPRTFPNNEWVQSEAGQNAVRHVLLAAARHNPRVG